MFTPSHHHNINWRMTHYPAQPFFFIIWNHSYRLPSNDIQLSHLWYIFAILSFIIPLFSICALKTFGCVLSST
jgi:hypothetical protein